MKKFFLFPMILFLPLLACNKTTETDGGAGGGIEGVVSITDFGASVDANNNAKAIQKAIDQCEKVGGGIVTVPPGTFFTGTVYLKDNVHLWLHPEATLKGVPDPAVFKDGGMIVGNKIKKASITGGGTLDGHGNHANFQFGNNAGPRGNVLRLIDCNDILIKDVSLVNSQSWTFRMYYCDGVRVHNVKVRSLHNWNNDGIDIGSRNVVISDCIIDADDDALCFKSEKKDFTVENVTVTNCIIGSNCNAIKFGTASYGGFRNISISNCVVRKAAESNIQDWPSRITGLSSDPTVISGIALEVVDGGFMDRIVINNIAMQDVQTPLFIRLGSRDGAGTLKNVIISGITARNESLITSSITGIPGHSVENVTIRDVFFDYVGGGTESNAAMVVGEKENAYPENRMFGNVLPAYGLYVRHVKGLTMENIQFVVRRSDARPAFIFDDVQNVLLNNFQATAPTNNAAIVRLVQSSDFVISGFRSQQNVPLFLRAEGANCKNIDIRSNDFSKVQTKTSLNGVSESEIKQ